MRATCAVTLTNSKGLYSFLSSSSLKSLFILGLLGYVCLFEVLNHFTHFLVLLLDNERISDYLRILRLGGEGVGLPVDFLKQKIKPLADTASDLQGFTKLTQVASQTGNLF